MHCAGIHPSVRRFPALPGALLLMLLWQVPAFGQSQSPRIAIAVNGGLQAASSGMVDGVVFTEFAEQGNLDVRYPGANGPLFDANLRVRITDRFAVGGGVSLVSLQEPAELHARLPHPLRFRQHRVVAAPSPGLERRETVVNVHAAWVMPVGPSVDLTVFAGPTMVALTQELVDRIEYAHAYPYTSASVTGAAHAPRTGSKVGLMVGVDVAYYVVGTFGLGGTVQFSRVSLALDSAGDGTLRVDAGGLQATGGVRFRF